MSSAAGMYLAQPRQVVWSQREMGEGGSVARRDRTAMEFSGESNRRIVHLKKKKKKLERYVNRDRGEEKNKENQKVKDPSGGEWGRLEGSKH